MCGIAGIYSNSVAVNEALLSNMSGCLSHRGSDGNGKYIDTKVGLAHTRLSIIDLSEHGNQPLYNEDRSLVLICNGEIYNYQNIRESLIRKGHTFSSHSDCEVILHLYEEYRNDIPRLLSELTGMFAFALWDIPQQKMVVVRDRIGIKPLYYSHTAKYFAFASEVSGISASGLSNYKIDYTSLYEYFLLGNVPGPHTIYEGINALEPGHYLVLNDGKADIKQYWAIPAKVKNWKSEGEVAEATEALLTEVIKDHLVADVPVGTFLSAGVDSSIITALAVKHHPGINSFTVSFPGEPEDEGVIANETAGRLGTTHHSFNITENFFEGFQYHNKYLDQPFAVSSALFLGQISRLAKNTVKVVLSGDGGDELFGGYDFRHQVSNYPAFFSYIPKAVGNIAGKIAPGNSWTNLWKEYHKPESTSYLSKVWMQVGGVTPHLFSVEVDKHIDKERYIKRLDTLFESWDGNDDLNKKLYVDVKTSLVDEMLTKCDRMTMRNGIEGRVPFLDHRFVEHAFSIPGKYKRDATGGKLVLRKILAKHLGKELAYRDKTGFNSPLPQWLSAEPSTKAFADKYFKDIKKMTFLNQDTVNATAQNMQKNSRMVYALICLANFMENNPRQ